MSVKKTFSRDLKTCTVTFEIPAEAAAGAKDAHLAGDFNSWSATCTPMKKNRQGGFSVKLDLEAGKSYQFRYVFDGSRWENDWNADAYIPAPFSNTDNSVVNAVPPEKAKAPAGEKKSAPSKKRASLKGNKA